ncbi:MAG: ankyrin repeat domain-containing protein [Armatimonadetes bacterium]|nr:ankyrin repeat domain-containing protein [Armatimonadota bacterium]
MATPAPAQVEQFKTAVQSRDVGQIETLFRDAPEMVSVINDPLFSFDAPAIVYSKNHREMVDALLAHGADINARSAWWAGGFGVLDETDPETAAYLIERGAVVDAHAAAGLGMIDRLRELLDADPSLVHAKGGDGYRPLHFAEDREIMDLLLERGADLNARDLDHHGTAAQWAIHKPEKLRYLVDHGAETDIFIACVLGDMDLAKAALNADPDALSARIGKEPYTAPGGHAYAYTLGYAARPLLLAAEHGHTKLLDYLLSRSTPAQRLLLACGRADEAAVDALLAEQPDLAQTLPPEEMSFIADMAWKNRLDAVRLMLRAGFDVDAKGLHDSTALHRAAMHGFLKMVDLLLEHGASLEVKNEFEGTPLTACVWGSVHVRDKTGDYPACVERMIAAGAPVPEEAGGSNAVKEVLIRHGSRSPVSEGSA